MELFGMLEQKIECELGIGGIILRPAWGEHLAVLGECGGMEGKQHEELVLAKRIDDRPLGELKDDRDGPAAEALAQRPGPFVDHFGPVLELKGFARLAGGDLQTQIVFAVGPVQADEGGEAGQGVGFGLAHGSPPGSAVLQLQEGHACPSSAKAL
jgi:hypothetical protein